MQVGSCVVVLSEFNLLWIESFLCDFYSWYFLLNWGCLSSQKTGVPLVKNGWKRTRVGKRKRSWNVIEDFRTRSYKGTVTSEALFNFWFFCFVYFHTNLRCYQSMNFLSMDLGFYVLKIFLINLEIFLINGQMDCVMM